MADFFFQAEDGIRGFHVTGVQTCALPICSDETTNTVNRSLCYPVSCKIATDRYTGLDEGENRSNLFRDDYFIRLSETILLRAEAKQRLGNKEGAAADINLLRKRAACTYLVTAADL